MNQTDAMKKAIEKIPCTQACEGLYHATECPAFYRNQFATALLEAYEEGRGDGLETAAVTADEWCVAAYDANGVAVFDDQMTELGRVVRALITTPRKSPWHDIVSAPKDGTEILFCRKPPYSATGNIVKGFWHDAQNVPGWTTGYSRVIDTKVWTRWAHLPLLPDPPESGDETT